MQPAWRVLAPIDLSINPERPVEHATNTALAMGAELTLFQFLNQRRWRVWNALPRTSGRQVGHAGALVRRAVARWLARALRKPGDRHSNLEHRYARDDY